MIPLATAAAAASISIAEPSLQTSAALPRKEVVDRYRRWFFAQEPRLAMTQYVYSPTRWTPSWLESVNKSISTSVFQGTTSVAGDGRWLTQEVANAATDFFDATADLLPSTPYVYSSRRGDLVAEFEGTHGRLTAIVSPDFVILFAVVDGAPVERQVSDLRFVREEVRRITDQLTTGAHGEVAARE